MPRPVTALPKAHLHLHFTGSMRVETVRELAEKHGLRLPDALTTGYPPRLSARDERGWFRFQRLYDAARACVRDEADLRRIVREAAAGRRQPRGRAGWRSRSTRRPTPRSSGGITPALEIVLDEAAAASREGSTQVAVVVAASRIRHPLDARTLARLAAQHAGEGAGHRRGVRPEQRRAARPTADFAPAFAIARRAGLALGAARRRAARPDRRRGRPWRRSAPDRIGHGVRSVEDPGCSSWSPSRESPSRCARAATSRSGSTAAPPRCRCARSSTHGIPVALGADDPLLFGSRLADQYELARDALGFTDEELAALAAARSARRGTGGVRDAALADIDAWLATPAD